MRILISHVNFPSQFRRLLLSWVDDGHEIVFLARQREWHASAVAGFEVIYYNVDHRNHHSFLSHPYLKRLTAALLEGQEVFRIANDLKERGWYPDCVISHVGFGNGLFLKDCFPLARRIGLVEWFYNAENSDVDFLPPNSVSDDHRLQLRMWNAECLIEISSLDKIVVPTFWQKQQFPELLRDKIHVVHEGIDVDVLKSLRHSKRQRPACLPSGSNIEVLTYVSRTFEAYRGFPQVLEVLSRILMTRPNLHVLMVGQDGASYGPARQDGLGWSEWALKNLKFDPERIHWLGSIQENQYHDVLSVSDVHLYLTVPFILSWSLLEAMAAGCPIVASNTAPVTEVLTDEKSALLVDFFSTDALVNAISRILDDSCLSSLLSRNAQRKALDYSVDAGAEAWNRLLFH